MLLVALHNLDKRPLVDLTEREKIRFVRVQAHSNLVLLDVLGLSYDNETDYAILRKVLSGASFSKSSPPPETINRPKTLGESVFDSLTPSAQSAIHKLVWVKSSDDTEIDRSEFMEETRQLVCTQSAPHVVFFECPAEQPAVPHGHLMYGFDETDFHSPMHKLAALRVLASLLIQCHPLQASRLC